MSAYKQYLSDNIPYARNILAVLQPEQEMLRKIRKGFERGTQEYKFLSSHIWKNRKQLRKANSLIHQYYSSKGS